MMDGGTPQVGAAPPQSIRPRSKSEWEQVYAARRTQAAADKRHEFFFLLDRDTEPDLSRAAFSKDGYTSRVPASDWPIISAGLNARLRARWFGRRVPQGIEDQVAAGRKNFDAMKAILALHESVAAAVDALPGKLAQATALVVDFGAGRVRAEVPFGFGNSKGRIRISDPDSYFIWFFPEFGLLVRQVLGGTKGVWTDDFLKALMHGCMLYCGRFEIPRPLTRHTLPMLVLDGSTSALKAREADINAKFTQLVGASADMESLMTACMKASARTF